MESQSLDYKLKLENLSQIEKANNMQAILFAIILIVAGIGALVAGFLQKNMQTAWFAIGAVILTTAILIFLLKRKQNRYKSTGSPVKKYNYYMTQLQLNPMILILNHTGFSLAQPFSFSQNSNVRMEVVLSSDKQFAAAQLSSYIPFEYQPVTKVYCFTGAQAVDFADFLTRCKNLRS